MAKIFTFKNKRHMPTWLAWVLACVVKLYAWTFRVTIEDPDHLIGDSALKGVVFPIWHNRILFLGAVAPESIRTGKYVLISNSRDGEYVSAFIRFFGLNVVRGSSSRGAVSAMRQLNEVVERGNGVILTVDGPRGPRYSVHSGAGALAMKNRVPLVGISLEASRFWALKSWDGTQIPKPFSRVILRFGKKYYPAEESSSDEVNRWIAAELHRLSGEVSEQA